MSKARITLICADMSRNGFGRAYVLARVLSRSYEVKVVGAQFGRGVWSPMAGLLEAEGIEVCSIPSARHPRFFGAAAKLREAIDGDVLYPLKPYPTSFGFALAHRRSKPTPVILDIDDWELGNLQAMSRGQRWGYYLRGWSSPNHLLGVKWLYGRVQEADAITVSSRLLQKLYGGVLVPHGRDTTEMDPATVSGEEVRRQFGLEGHVVLFFGTPRPHKGIEELMAAVEQLQRADVTCVIVGANLDDPYDASLGQRSAGQVRLLPMQPFERVPAFMAAADVVVVPQRQTTFGEAQMPAKLYDAMAMARPIVATQISDIPEALAGCGIVVPPGDIDALAGAIAHLLDHPQEARQLGLAARAKCQQLYSWDAMQQTLEELVEKVLPKGWRK